MDFRKLSAKREFKIGPKVSHIDKEQLYEELINKKTEVNGLK